MRFAHGGILVLLPAIAQMAGSNSAQLADKKTLTLAIEKHIAAAGETEAIKNKFTMVIAVLDDGGNLIYLGRIDETQLASIQIAQGKAHTALAFKRPTKALEDAVAGGRNPILSMPGAVLVEGGLPLATPDGKIIGSIGVSGGTSPRMGLWPRPVWRLSQTCSLNSARCSRWKLSSTLAKMMRSGDAGLLSQS
jgi:glc operon protein GlcG